MFACELEARAEDAYLDGVVCLDLLVFDGVLVCDISTLGMIKRCVFLRDDQDAIDRSTMSCPSQL